ncbi:MAG: hypothetical protein ACFFDN_06365 [Candidatus Hodarchaeota archaeon]
MLVNLETEKIAKVGIPTTVSSIFNMNEIEETYIDILWGGVRLFIKRPCAKELIISKNDIFYKGIFENGVYKRLRSIPISRRVVPSINSRISYFIRANLSLFNNKTKNEENYFKDDTIVIKPVTSEPTSSHPINVKIKGVAITIPKDCFVPDEIFDLDYNLENYRDLNVELIQDITTICQCPEFWRQCIHNKKKPPIQRTALNIKNPPTIGKLNFKIPKDAEPSHNYIWETQVSLGVKHRIADQNSWYLKIEATSFKGEKTQFTIPINIIEGKIIEPDLFSPIIGEKSKALEGKIITPDQIELVKKEIEGDNIKITLKNKTKYNFEGVTIQISGIQSEFFELPPYMIGKIKWDSGKDITVSYKYNPDITMFQLKLEDNNQNTVSKNIS